MMPHPHLGEEQLRFRIAERFPCPIASNIKAAGHDLYDPGAPETPVRT
jgi:hypothetical protein